MFINKIILSLTIIASTILISQDVTGGYLDDGSTGTGITGGVTDGGVTGGDFIVGCMDPCAENYTEGATVDDGSCNYQNCECFYGGFMEQNYPWIYQCFLAAMEGNSCEEMEELYGFDCTLVESCDYCPTDGHDAGNDVDCPSTCSDQTCDYWVDYGYSCDELESYYGCNCTGCDCGSGDCDDVDEDGICDDDDDCIGEYDSCDICNGDGSTCSGCGNLSWIGDGYCDDVNNNTNCLGSNGLQDGGDCCPGDCVDADYSCDEVGGTCDDCTDPNSPDLATDGQCYEQQPPEFDINVELVYPVNEEQILDYNNTIIQWNYTGNYIDSLNNVKIFFAYNYGGGLKEVANNIDLNNGYVNVDLTRNVNGESFCDDYNPDCVEGIFGKLKIIVSDFNGNSSESHSSSLIIGEPEGDIGINWLDESDNSLIIDWGWLNNQEIIIQEDALSSLSEFSRLKILDYNGINTTDCDTTAFGEIVLLSISLSNDIDPQGFNIDCGFDYCFEGGDRIMGYQDGNPIYFHATDADTGEEIVITPILDNEQQTPYFNNGAIVIVDFHTDGHDNVNTTNISIEDERAFDSFGVYNKIGSINRDCEIVEGCTDEAAENFEPNANQLDCSCYYDNDIGCTDDTADNYNPDAATPCNTDEENDCCIYDCVVGCIDNGYCTIDTCGFDSPIPEEAACNYNEDSVVNYNCLYEDDCLSGCTDASACNFDGSIADGWIDDGSCNDILPFDDELNPGWCPLEVLTEVTTNTYYDRLPLNQESSSVDYRVWLLDEDGNLILKTLDTTGIEIECSDFCEDDDGNPGYIDDCGECIIEENLCDDCYLDSLVVGDITGDGNVLVTDLVSLVNIIVNEIDQIGFDLCIADISGDGVVNVIDVVQIVNMILG